MKELKQLSIDLARVTVIPFNRTMKELKLLYQILYQALYKAFNRTMKELKRKDYEELHRKEVAF